MTTTIKITELADIGANLANNTLVPVVNMTGTPTTERANLNNLSNFVLNLGVGANLGAVGDIRITGGTSGQKLTTDGAGGLSWTNDANSSYGNGNVATFLASYGSNTITTTGNITAGNLVGNVSAGNITTANITVNTRANLGAVGNVKITGGTNGYVLQTDGAGNLSWTAQTGGGGNGSVAGSNTQVQFNDAGSFGANSGFTFDKTAGALASPMIDTAAVYHLAGTVVENADLTHGATAALIIPSNGDTSNPVQITNTYGNITLTTGINSGSLQNWSFTQNGYSTRPYNVVDNTTNGVICNAGTPTIIYTATGQFQHTLKLLIQVEGLETAGQWDTQSCEMVVAKSFRNNNVVGSVYGLAYTSTNPLATFNAVWNVTLNRVQITCTPTSLTNGVTTRVCVTEMVTSD